jgi:hypothetical protein
MRIQRIEESSPKPAHPFEIAIEFAAFPRRGGYG